MQSSSAPKKLSIPFANSGDKQNIPDASQIGIEGGRASYTDGFPPLTGTPTSAGGIPPFKTDFNGVLYDITSSSRWAAAGAYYKYDSAFSTSIGGYPKGAILINSSSDGFWQSTAENNTNNPDTGGSGWISALGGRLLNCRTFTSSGTYTPSPGVKKIIVECCGGGGGGGGSQATSSSLSSVGGSGGAGAYIKVMFNSAPSATVVIGGGGSGNTGNSSGNNGGNTTFIGTGASVTAYGGTGGVSPVTSSALFIVEGMSSPAPTQTGGTTLSNNSGAWSHIGFSLTLTTARSGSGGSNYFGTGANGVVGASGLAPTSGYGGGGSGAVSWNNSIAYTGGSGLSGYLVVWEYS